MYGKKKRAKENKQRQQKGIISTNSFFKCLGQTPRRQMLWDKHLFIRNATEPDGLCGLCVSSCARGFCLCFHAQTAQTLAQKEAHSRPGRTPLTSAGAAGELGVGYSHSVVLDMTKATSKRTNINPMYVQNCLALFVQVSTNIFFLLLASK